MSTDASVNMADMIDESFNVESSYFDDDAGGLFEQFKLLKVFDMSRCSNSGGLVSSS
jgi:hypothetical protein